jgi:hypothetical protein
MGKKRKKKNSEAMARRLIPGRIIRSAPICNVSHFVNGIVCMHRMCSMECPDGHIVILLRSYVPLICLQ